MLHVLLPYPELAGKLQHPDNRLLTAQCGPGVGLVCGALGRLVAEQDRAAAMYRMLDRCKRMCCVLYVPGDPGLIKNAPGAAHPAMPSSSEGHALRHNVHELYCVMRARVPARRHGRGLGPRGLQRLAAGVASLTAAEAAFCVAVLDRHGAGSVTLDDIVEGMATVGAESRERGDMKGAGAVEDGCGRSSVGFGECVRCCVVCAKTAWECPLARVCQDFQHFP